MITRAKLCLIAIAADERIVNHVMSPSTPLKNLHMCHGGWRGWGVGVLTAFTFKWCHKM